MMQNKEVADLIQMVDLVVGDTALIVPTILADYYHVPTLFLSTFGHFVGILGDVIANVETPSYIRMLAATALEEKIGLPLRMNFRQRSYNSFMYMINKIVRRTIILPTLDPLAIKYTNKTILELCKHVNIVLVPMDFSIEHARPLPPTVKMIGPLTARKAKSLSQPLKGILERSEKVIVVSFGAMDALEDILVEEFAKAFFVGSTEAPSKAFLLFFLLPDWLELNHLKGRMECGFSDIFSRHICSTVAETIVVTNYAANFGAKKCSGNDI